MKHIYTFKQFIQKPLLVALALLAMSGNAWGWSKTFYAKCKVVSQPATGGYVYVSKSGQTSVTYDKTTDESTNKVKKSGLLGSAPSSASVDFFAYQQAKDGYTFNGWSTNKNATSGSTTTKNYTSWFTDYPYYPLSITATSTNESSPTTVTYYAIFTPNKYDVTLAPNGGSGSNQTVTATYDAAMPTTLKAGGAIVKPSKTGYTFTGYYDATSGGTKYYNANLTSARTWNKASTGVTLYAQWTPNNYTITLNAGEGTTSAGTTSITATFDADTNLKSAITTPTKSGKVFDGYYTGTNGAGTQIIDEFGNVIASAGGGSTYTDANKKWKYAGSIELFAKWIDKYTPSMTGANQSMMVDGEQTNAFTFEHVSSPVAHITVKSISSVNNGNGKVIEYDAANNKIIAHNAGVATIYFKQAETSTIKEGTSATYTYTVYKYNSTFANVDNKNVKVDANVTSSYSLTYTKPNANYIGTADIAAGTPVLGASTSSFYYTLTQNVTTTKTAGSPDPTLAIAYNAGTKTATGKNAGTGTVHLYQPETYKYNAADRAFTVTVTKNDNSLNCSWGSWSKTMSVDSEAGVTFSSNNASTQIDVKVAQGDTIAEYTGSKIKSNCNLGVAKWTISQDETYKYNAPTAKTLMVTVAKESDPGCEITLYEDNSEKTASNIGEIDLGGVGVTLYFYIKYNGLGGTATLSTYNSETRQWTDQSVSASVGGYTKRTITLGENVTQIKFGKNGGFLGTDDPYIKDIQVTRQKYFNLQDAKKVNISTLEMTNYIGGNTTSATFFVDYSTCAGTIKIASNNDHITVSPTSFNTNSKAGRKEITVTYASDEAEAINAVITAYTPYENKRIDVHAATQKKPQDLTWSTIFASETVSLPMTFACNNAATASTNLPVTYSTGNDEIIKISDDRLSFTIVGSGTTTLTATQEGDEEWQTVSETKTIVATSKKIQVISWTQNLNKAVTIGDNIPLEAKVKVYTNIATGAMELDEERTNLITYSCPANNGVVEITNDKQIRVLGYGTTTVTAKVGEDADYESAAPVTLPVRIRKKNTGDCEASLAFIQEAEIEFSETGMGFNTLTRPRIAHKVEISDPDGVPDSLTFDVRGEYFTAPVINTQHFKGDIEVYESIDGGVSWSDKLTSVTGKVNDVVTSTTVKVSPNVTNLMFVRPQGGEGYHYVGNIKITSKPFIRTAQTTINLGNIALGAVTRRNIDVEYSSVKGNLTVAQAANGDEGLTVEEMIYVECGNVVEYPLEINVAPTKAGSWTNKVIVSDPKQPSLTLQINLSANVTKGTQAIVWNPAQEITTIQAPTLNAYATSGLEVSYEVTDGDDVASIVNGQVVIAKDGEFTITVTQNGNDDYNAAEDLVKTFTVSKATPTLEWANAPQELACNASGTIYKAQSSSDEGAITYAITAGSNYATINATTGELTILQFEKEITIQASQAESVKFNAPEPITVDVTIAAAPEENTFTNNAGDNNWNNPANWEIGFAPIGETPNVVINGDLDIEGNDPISVGDLTINTGKTVTIKDGATLVVDGESQTREAYGNIIVEAGGQLHLGNGVVNVNDFTLYSVAGDGSHAAKSGQVSNHVNLKPANAYFVLDLDPNGETSYGWYDFTVPFPVDALNGVTRLDNGNWLKVTNEVDYAIMTFYEDLRSQGQYPWKKFRSVMQPGKLYSITTAGVINSYRFAMKSGSDFNAHNYTLALRKSEGSDNLICGWNGIGNGTLTYVKFNNAAINKVQMYDHMANAYDPIDPFTSVNFVVGSAYLVQTNNEVNLVLSEATDYDETSLRAPQRTLFDESVELTLRLDNDGKYCDRLFLTCSDNASEQYTIGEDLMKMGTLSASRKGRLWTNAKGADLCMMHAAYNGNEAIIPLHMFAPVAGEYSLSLERTSSDEVYIMRNGVIVWNIAWGDYTFDLSAGTDNSYAVRVARRVQNTATGVDATDNDKRGTDFAEKMIVNGQLFILRDGILYDAQGKKVSKL